MSGSDLSTSRNTIVADFTSADYASLRADFVSYAQAKFGTSARWTDFNDDQPEVAILELLAYLGDLLCFQVNAGVRENFLSTCIRRENAINHLKPFGAVISNGDPSTATLTLTLDPAGSYPFTINPWDHLFGTDGDFPLYFHPVGTTTIPAYVATVDIEVEEGEYYSDVLVGVSTGAQNQRWQFPQTQINRESVVLTVGGRTWTEVSSFVQSSAFDFHFKLIQNDSLETFAVFGDGVLGAIPSNTSEIRASYHDGGGRRGNLTPGSIVVPVTVNANILSHTNADRASGGTPADSLKVIKGMIPSLLSALERGVTSGDYAALARTVAGVSKAIGGPGLSPGASVIRTLVAPSGGGDPTATVKNAVLAYQADRKMVTNRLQTGGPVYRDYRLEVLLHVNPSFRASAVKELTRRSVINPAGTGFLDFEQLDFAGLDASDDNQPFFSQTKLQGLFNTLRTDGLERVEILRMDVAPVARARSGSNSGNGTIADDVILLNGRQRRRQFFVQLVSSTQAKVYERITGYVSSLTDTQLIDRTKLFDDEVDDYTGYRLIPDARFPTRTVALTGVADQTIEVNDPSSLFVLTSPGQEYFLYNQVPTSVSVGSQFSTADESVKFTLVAGSIPFINGDAFTIDVFPVVSDVRLRDDEYPQLLQENFITRTSGGV